MSARYVRSKNGKRRWYRIALGVGAALTYNEIEVQMNERIALARRELAEWAAEDAELDVEAELELAPLVKLNDLADAFGCSPETFRKELKKLGLQPEIAACERHTTKRCDCKGARLLRVFEVELLLLYGREIYYRMVRRPGRMKVTKLEETK